MGSRRPSDEQLLILLEAQLILDEAGRQFTVAQSNGGIPPDIAPRDVTTWKLQQRATATAAIQKAQLEMTRWLTEFKVPVNVWRRKLRKEAAALAKNLAS